MNLETMRAIVAKADNPDVEIQLLNDGGKWEFTAKNADELLSSSKFGIQYRIKPNTITLNGKELPRPISRDSCSKGITVASVRYEEKHYIHGMQYYNFASKEDAQAWADALNELMGDSK